MIAAQPTAMVQPAQDSPVSLLSYTVVIDSKLTSPIAPMPLCFPTTGHPCPAPPEKDGQ